MDFKFEWDGDALCEELKKAADEACGEAAEIVLADCKPPVRTGALRDSGHVEKWPEKSHGTVGASVVYDAPHAHLVHELPPGKHLQNGEDKWLERATDRKEGEVMQHFESRIGGVLSDR